ncbi:MAG: hypothetical protein HC845_11045 [Akkermansiaceae bacterium]|nr:hypothetical protein [Akkermansiaceae bacterium]
MKWIALIFLTFLNSCMWLPRATAIPVKTLAAGTAKGQELIVFLPGRWSRVEEFQREKFFKIAEKRWPNARLVAADLHLGYYKNRSMARRLHEDIVLPAKSSGVKKIRVVGISMGGLGALIYDTEYPGQIDEMILLSPFVGEEEMLREIEAAGGLGNWKPASVGEGDFSRKLWLGLRENWLEKGNRPKVDLGCGEEDRLAQSNRLFVKEFLKPEEQKWIPGDHDWPTWRELFEK